MITNAIKQRLLFCRDPRILIREALRQPSLNRVNESSTITAPCFQHGFVGTPMIGLAVPALFWRHRGLVALDLPPILAYLTRCAKVPGAASLVVRLGMQTLNGRSLRFWCQAFLISISLEVQLNPCNVLLVLCRESLRPAGRKVLLRML